MSTDTATATVRRLPFDRLGAFPKLFQTYCSQYEPLSDFYAGDYRKEQVRKDAAARAAAPDRDREQLADVLLDQNKQWGLDAPTQANIERLRDPETVAVVTGQQVGLFTGPLYTLYKTITAVTLSEQLSRETGRPVVPVFWVEGEDHNFDEVASVQLFRRNELVTVRYDRPPEEEGQPVGRHVLTPAIEDTISQVAEAVPDSDFKPRLMEAVREAYQPGTMLEDAFTKLMQTFFAETGLVFINPDDARLKAQSASLFRRELEDHASIAERLQATSRRLEETYHAQVHVQPTNLFLLTEEGREPLDVDGEDRFRLRDSGRTFTRAELIRQLEEAPERFSPNVVLRPLMQDTLLPTAAYVAGPGEVSYFAQYKPAYEWAELPMPLIYPRASVTLVESKVQKVLDRYALSVADLDGDFEQLFRRVTVEAMDEDIDAMFDETTRRLHQAVNDLKPQVEGVDATLGSSVEAARAAFIKEIDQLQSRVVRAEKRKSDDVRAQLEKAQVNLFPDGRPQERALNPLYFFNKYSLGLVDVLQSTLSLDTTAHQVVEL